MSPQQYPYPFGRAWQISVTTQQAPPGFGDISSGQFEAMDLNGPTYTVSSTVASDESPLRVTFNIDTYAQLAYWTAEISIYNLNPSTAGAITANAGTPDVSSLWAMNKPIVAGDVVNVSAGYTPSGGGPFDPGSNLIYTGTVYQPMWTRENVVDYKLTLRCVSQLAQDALNFVSIPMQSGHTDQGTLTAICNAAGIPIDPSSDQAALDRLAQKTYSRGESISGKPLELLDPIIKGNGLASWLGPRGLAVRLFDPNTPVPTPDFAYGPPNLNGTYTTGGTTTGSVKQTLIETPEQTQLGIRFKVLLDSSISIGDIVQLAPGALPVPFAFTYRQQRPAVPNQPGVYVVAGLRHFGDSRGRASDWYTEITGVTMNFFASFLTPGLQASGNANTN